MPFSVILAALGILIGLLLLEEWWYGPIIGAAVGLLIGAIVDAQRDDGEDS